LGKEAIGSGGHGLGQGATAGIIGRLVAQQNADQLEEPIGDAAQGPRMVVATLAELSVHLSSARVFLPVHVGRVKEGVTETARPDLRQRRTAAAAE
jgi:hypothetical protein